MRTTSHPNERATAAAFFRNVRRLLEFENVEAQALQLKLALAKTEASLRQERAERLEAERQFAAKEAEHPVKSLLFMLLLKLPVSWQPFAGRIVRWAWPGFSEA